MVTLPVAKEGDDFVIIAGSLTFRERSVLDLALAVRMEMRIEKFRFLLPDGTTADHDFSKEHRYPNSRG